MKYDPRYGVYMPDGALRAAGIGNTSNPAILAQQPALIDPASIPVPAPRPVLTTALPDTVHEYDMPMPAPPALLPQAPPSRPANPNAAPATAARRDVVRMAQGLPDMPERPDMTLSGGEQLMRIGGAILGGAQKGGLAAMEAGSNTLGKIQDYNRAQQLAEYTEQVNTRNALVKAQQEARKAEMERQTKLDIQLLKNEKAGAGKGKGKGDASASLSAIVVNDAIERALPMIDGFSAGGIGSILSDMPIVDQMFGTDARTLKGHINTIKANAGFDKLQAMRDASPTGGALGQVSEREIDFLQATFGDLSQIQDPEVLKEKLVMFRFIYNSMIHGMGNHAYQPPAGSERVVSEYKDLRRQELARQGLSIPAYLQSGSQGGSAQQPAQQQSSASSADMSDADLYAKYRK